MHRLGSFKKLQEQRALETQQRTGSTDTGKSMDSGNWAGRTTSDEESDGDKDEKMEELEGPPSAAPELQQEVSPSEKPVVDEADAESAKWEGEPSRETAQVQSVREGESWTPAKEAALSMPGSFDVEPEDFGAQEGLIARLKKMFFGFGT